MESETREELIERLWNIRRTGTFVDWDDVKDSL